MLLHDGVFCLDGMNRDLPFVLLGGAKAMRKRGAIIKEAPFLNELPIAGRVSFTPFIPLTGESFFSLEQEEKILSKLNPMGFCETFSFW